jgi:hypothetical protein
VRGAFGRREEAKMVTFFMRLLFVGFASFYGALGFFPETFGASETQALYARLVTLSSLWILLTDYRLELIENRQRAFCELMASQFGIISTWMRRECIFQQNREQEEEEADADRD